MLVTMSDKELCRINVIQSVVEILYFTITTATLGQRLPQKNCANAMTLLCLLKRSENG